MAAAYDDDSTDDEIGMNLQLAERLNIHRGEYPQSSSDHHYENGKDYKQYFNAPKQRHFPDSFSSVDASHKDCPYSIMHGSYIPPNKKRQNGDKTFEQFANPKRTCLNGRYPNGADWRDSKKYEKNDIRYNGSKFFDSLHQQSEQSTSSQGLHPDKTYEDHLNNLADAEDSDLDMSSKFAHRIKERLKEQIAKGLPNHSVSCTSGVCPEPHTPYQSVTRHGVQFVESGSDEDSKTTLNGALKGGRQSPDIAVPKRKVIGRKSKKVLDSDDTDDECWKSGYRGRAVVFSSSDSEDGSHELVGASENGTSKYANHSSSRKNVSPHCNHYSSRRQKSGIISRHRRSPSKSSHNPTSSFRSQNFAGDGCSSQFNTSVVPTELHGKIPNKSCRSRQSSTRSSRPPSAIAENFVSNINPPTSSMRGRNRTHGSARCLGLPSPPHSNALHSHPRSGSKGSRNRSLSSCRSRREKADLVAAYPELFEAEDSSEVEFFTANSYSDTETSNESLRDSTLHATFVNTSDPPNNRDIICEHSVNIASSEDEISVVFSTAPHARNSEQRRNGRALGRRYGRGTVHRHFQNNQEVVSLSPDPVEQVRQMEEDEGFARMLQAEFDAEVNAPRQSAVIHFENWSESDDNSFIDPVGDSESEEPFESPLLPFVQRVEQMRRRGQRLSNRVTANVLRPPTPTGIFNRRRTEGRHRRPTRTTLNEASSWQIARWFGLSSNAMPSSILSPFESSEDDYETLLTFTELNGDVPRGLQRSDINRLPTRQYRGSKVNSSESADGEISHKRTELNKECQVCLTDYVPGDVLRILPCFHEFHTPCIDPWLKINHTCPVCRVIVDLGV